MKRNLFLVGILMLAFSLRFWKLDSYPALNADEAAIGYNAYSLVQTGMDEHGNAWPIHFQSFNDYKPGLYFYLVLPFVRLLGLNEWAVRIPNALLGVATVYLIYLLVNEMFKKKEKSNKEFPMAKNKENLTINHQLLAITASFMLAISPWHIHFSRGGWEVNVASFFMILGVYFYLKCVNWNIHLERTEQIEGSKRKVIFLVLSSLSFVLSLYTYHAARMITPLLLLGILGIYHEEIRKNIKIYLLSGLIAVIALLPLVKDLIKPEISSRAAGVGLFADVGPLNRINEQRGEHTDFNGIWSKLLHNKGVNYSLEFFENWTAHYHGLFLFLSGDDIQRDKVPETGQMYMLDALWLTIGIIFILKSKIVNLKSMKLVFWWLFVAPTAAALTFQSPHALRSENMVIPLIIISAIGLSVLLNWVHRFSSESIAKFVYLFIGLFIFWNFFRYEHMYWVHMSKEYPYSSQYGVKELASYIKENSNKYNKILITDKFDQPYILFLFYLKYSPDKFQKEHVLTERDRFGFSTVRNYDKFVFKSISWDTDKLEYHGSLIVGTGDEIPKEANIVKKIYGTNGFEYFRIVVN